MIKIYRDGKPYLKLKEAIKDEEEQQLTTSSFEHDIVVFSTENPLPMFKFGYRYRKLKKDAKASQIQRNGRQKSVVAELKVQKPTARKKVSAKKLQGLID